MLLKFGAVLSIICGFLMYYSEQFTRVMKRNSFTVLLDNGHTITVCYYIVVGRLDYLLLEDSKTNHTFQC